MGNHGMQLDALTILNAVPGNYLFLLPDEPRFTIAGASDAYLRVTFTTREEIIGRGLFEVFPDNPDLSEATGVKNLSASLYHVLEHKTENRMADQRYDVVNPLTGNFEFKVWSPVNKPVFNKTGALQYILHSVEDVTERVKLEQEARVANEARDYQQKLLYSLFMQAPVSIVITRGADHVIELANNAMLKIWGRTEDQVIGKPAFEALPQLVGQGYEQILTNVLETGQTFIANELVADVTRSGIPERMYFNFIFEPLKGLNGSITGVILVANEITSQVMARKKVEEKESQLLRINDDLRQTNENLEQFAYAASHDLKEPVRKIRTFLNRLKTELAPLLNDDQKFYVERMEVATKRMWTLIDDLLLYSFVTQGASFETDIRLNEVIVQVLEDLELEMEQKQAKVTVDPLPTITGHRRQIQQLFHNLIGNALKYSKPDTPPEIHIHYRESTGKDTDMRLREEGEKEKKFHVIKIQDNGIGFEQKDARRIFHVFTRLSGNPENPGTGVGLSIVKKVVENHKGYVWAEGKEGVGATFTVLLPADYE